jgi:hypothetical protein
MPGYFAIEGLAVVFQLVLTTACAITRCKARGKRMMFNIMPTVGMDLSASTVCVVAACCHSWTHAEDNEQLLFHQQESLCLFRIYYIS